MINSVGPQVEFHKNNPFDIVSPQLSESTFWLNNKKLKKTSILKLPNPEDIIMTPEKARKTHNTQAIGLSIAGAVILIAGGVYFLLHGGPKGFAKCFQKLRLHYERKLQQSKLNGLKSSGHYEYILGKIDKWAQKAEAINNYNTVKDYIFKKIMYGSKNDRPVTRKIHSAITELFERFGLKTVKNSYQKTAEKFSRVKNANDDIIKNLTETIKDNSELTINGIKKTKKEWIQIAKEKDADILQLYSDNFNTTIRETRYLRIKKFIKTLEQNFDKEGLKKQFLSKDALNTFIADAKIAPQKAQLQEEIKAVRQKISYSPKDLYQEAMNYIMKISSTLSVKDTEALIKLNRLGEYLKQASKTGKTDIKKLDELNSDLCLSLFRASHGKSFNDYKLIAQNRDNLRNLCCNFKQGEIQDVLDIYRKLLPREEFTKIEKSYTKAANSLDKSIKLETDDFVSKARDLALGSAPTDIATILLSVAGLGYYLGTTDDKRQRMSVLLKYGIPAVAGIGVSLYSNARLFAGTKSLLFGLISMKIINIIGNRANKMLNKYYDSNTNSVETDTGASQEIN